MIFCTRLQRLTIWTIFLGLITLLCFSTVKAENSKLPCVIVSVAPHKFFVEQIAGQTLQVYLMVPAGASSHTYEPTPKQIMNISCARIWFVMGEFFENRALNALKSYHPDLEAVDLRQGVDLIYATNCCKHCCQGNIDLHIWLSARQAQIQAKTIAQTLSRLYPQHAELYQSNFNAFQAKLRALDGQIQTLLEPLTNRTICVSHPAYAYFARDYGLCQQAIEVEGKDPTPQQMTALLQQIKAINTHTIFIQMQYNNKAAKLVAETINAKLVTLNPYAEEFLASMLEIAHAFANQ